MNHKRGRPKNARGGCLLCKGYKVKGKKSEHYVRPSERRANDAAASQMKEI